MEKFWHQKIAYCLARVQGFSTPICRLSLAIQEKDLIFELGVGYIFPFQWRKRVDKMDFNSLFWSLCFFISA